MIKADVIDQHISRFPDELPLLKKIEPDFDVVWARRYVEFNAQVSAYFLKPLKHISEAFGFESEIVMIYSAYESVQARTVQALDRIMSQTPAFGRVDQSAAILVSRDSDPVSWIRRYTAENPQSRVLIGLKDSDLLSFKDAWELRNRISSQLYARDLFDYSLPINNDIFFFGRSSDVAAHVDAIRRSENRGLFGLRKSGKTSLLFKVQRECERNNISAIYIDCKLPIIYRQSGSEFLEHICNLIVSKLPTPVKGWQSPRDGYGKFVRLIERMPDGANVCIILDEIEYISFFSKLASHWAEDFVPFWQTIWSAQSQYRKLSFIITGVNAAVVESDVVNDIQNPMFGIVKSKYLTGFDQTELEQLLRSLGRRMGLKFDSAAVAFLHHRYGGHPLLTRMICSHLNAQVRAEARSRPFIITRDFVESGIEDREEEVLIYCNHIVSELKQSYPDEYDMLQMLSIDDVTGFNELSEEEGYVRHLKAYGLVDFSKLYLPELKIPVLKKFIAREWRRSFGWRALTYVVPPEGRMTFVFARTGSILRDMRSLNRRFGTVGTPQLYDPAGPSEAEKFVAVNAVADEGALVQFLTQAQRSLVEPIDRKGGSSNYFFGEVRDNYPELWDALNRIRAYRNWMCHLELNPAAEAEYQRYLATDLGGVDPPGVQDGFFRVQAAILNGLAVAVQMTLAKYE